MGDQLQYVADHPNAEIAAICDEDPDMASLSLETTAAHFGLLDDQVYTDHAACLAENDIDIVVTCPVPTEHGYWVEQFAPYDVWIQLEKPFAASVVGCDQAIDAMADAGGELAINWPMAWSPSQRTAKRMVDEGQIGQLIEVHYFGGNRGGQRFTEVEYGDGDEMHFMGDLTGGGPIENIKAPERSGSAWWHRPDKGGGSLIDYMGYGTTLGTWFRDGELPISVTADTFVPNHMEVDTHAIAIAKYEVGLSKFETRWGTFTDPWVAQSQPPTGFVLVGTEGTIGSFSGEETVHVQTEESPEGTDIPVDPVEAPMQNPIQYMIDRLEKDSPVEYGPLRPDLCRDAQRINDAAIESAQRGEEVYL